MIFSLTVPMAFFLRAPYDQLLDLGLPDDHPGVRWSVCSPLPTYQPLVRQ